MSIAKFFNTAGPMRPDKQYCLPPLKRINLTEIMQLIEQEKYFLLHAPRQTGKTSCLLALMEHLNNTGQYKCLYVNIEPAQAARENVEQGIKAIVQLLASNAEQLLKDDTMRKLLDIAISGSYSPLAMLDYILSGWAAQSELPIVLLLDEVDALVGDTLISLLRQLRGGYGKRPEHFPSSILLCGVRDIHDYRIHSNQEKAIITGGSAFNVKARSLRLGNFTKENIKELYEQHTQATGQIFAEDIYDYVWQLTKGQPWLVNALAYEVCFEMQTGRDRTMSITKEMIELGKERLVQRRETHLDQLADKLREERVRRVIEPILAGENIENINHDDMQYLIDLGLLDRSSGKLEIANAIYMEIIPRELNVITQVNLEAKIERTWYIKNDGSLDIDKLLQGFQEFFCENGEIWLERYDYKEAAPQLLLQAFLQRIVNGGGDIIREYALGTKRTDLMIKWPYYINALKTQKKVQKEVIEIKIRYGTLEQTIAQGLIQTAAYLERLGLKEGHLFIFDRMQSHKKKKQAERVFCLVKKYEDKEIKVWGV